jgi:hypothetical protein
VCAGVADDAIEDYDEPLKKIVGEFALSLERKTVHPPHSVAISIFYALIVVGVLVPAGILLVGPRTWDWRKFLEALTNTYKEWVLWFPAGATLSGQIILLFLSVDTTWRRLKPRAHILVSSVVAGMLVALLTFVLVFCMKPGIQGDRFDHIGDWTIKGAEALGFAGLLWMLCFSPICEIPRRR